MNEKKPFVANKNHFYIFFGLFLCLLSIILCLNNRYVARVLSTPFTYAFGSLAYLLYVAANILGLRLIFAKRFFKVKINVYILASILVLVAATMFFTHFVSLNYLKDQYVALASNADNKTVNFLEAYNAIFDSIQGGYYSPVFLSLFSHPFAGGNHLLEHAQTYVH